MSSSTSFPLVIHVVACENIDRTIALGLSVSVGATPQIVEEVDARIWQISDGNAVSTGVSQRMK
jgi:hypothetical protein